jgi:hypothetical protein
MQSQQLLPKRQVLQKKLFSGAKAGDDPAEQMSKAHKHQGIIAKKRAGQRASKSLILQTRRVLARHRVPAQYWIGHHATNPRVSPARTLGPNR